MTRKLRILSSPQMGDVLLLDHALFAGFVKLSIPEFFGTTGARHFAIHQRLAWSELEPRTRASYRLEGDPAETGVDYHGSIAVVAEDEVSWQAALRNMQEVAIETAYHTIVLDMSGAPEFLDDYGERTYLFTDSGWARARDLLEPHVKPDGTASFRVGASYRGGTVVWRIIARLDASMRRIIGLALDRACAFALDHPHWSRGLLANCRWQSLEPRESKAACGKIYLLDDTLEGLRARYVRDFKGRVVEG